MEEVIRALEAQIVVYQQKADAANKDLAEARRMLFEARQFAKECRDSEIASIQFGQFRGLKPAQAIAAYLKSRGNPGISKDDIGDSLVAEGTVFKDKKYPKRGVSRAIANSDVFEERNGLIYLKQDGGK